MKKVVLLEPLGIPGSELVAMVKDAVGGRAEVVYYDSRKEDISTLIERSRDADAVTAAFQEFASRRMGREEQSSIRERLAQAKEQAEKKPEHRTVDREKVKVKDRSVQR